MADYIDRKELLEDLERFAPECRAAFLIIEKQEAVDAVPVVHGRWVDVRGIPSVNRKNVPIVKCSKCEIYFCDLINNHHYMYHYCPNCGARMDLKEESDA